MAVDHASSPRIIGFVVAAGLSAVSNGAVLPLSYVVVAAPAAGRAASASPAILGVSSDDLFDPDPNYGLLDELAAKKPSSLALSKGIQATSQEMDFLLGAYLKDYLGE